MPARIAARIQALRMLRAAAPRTPGSSAVVVLVVRSIVAVELLEASWRPVGLRRVASARAMEACDVLQRNEDVPVQLDVRHVLDRAVRGEDAFLIFAAEQREL